MYWLFGIPLFLYLYLAQTRGSREGLGLSTKQSDLLSLRIKGGSVGGCVEGMGGGERVGIWIRILKKINNKKRRSDFIWGDTSENPDYRHKQIN